MLGVFLFLVWFRTKPKKSLVQTLWAGNTNHRSQSGVLGLLPNEPLCSSLENQKVDAPQSDPVLKIIRLFGRNRPRVYGNYCLISGNSKFSSTLSERRVKMSRGSTWNKEETDIPSPLCFVRQKHVKSMLENV